MIVKKNILFFSLFFCFSLLLSAQKISLGINGNYFIPVDEDFKDIYGNGVCFGGELGLDVWKGLSIWTSGEYHSNSGELTFTREETKLRIISLELGSRYSLEIGNSLVVPFLGGGVGLSLFHESNPIGTVDKNGFSFSGHAGVLLKLTRWMALNVKGNYRYCQIESGDIEFNCGGFEILFGVKFIIKR
jgi:opacity protein-like surface antigen